MRRAKQRTERTSSQQPISPPASVTIDAPLSPQWAFIVQFRAVPGGPIFAAGRIEHLVSGRTAHFQSLQELLTYLDRELHATQQPLGSIEDGDHQRERRQKGKAEETAKNEGEQT